MKSYEVKILRHKILIEKKKKRHARTYTLVVKVTVVVCCFSASAQQHTHVGRFRTGRMPWFTQRKENEKNKVSIWWACTSACAGGAVRNRAPERQPTLARRTGFPIIVPCCTPWMSFPDFSQLNAAAPGEGAWCNVYPTLCLYKATYPSVRGGSLFFTRCQEGRARGWRRRSREPRGQTPRPSRLRHPLPR